MSASVHRRGAGGPGTGWSSVVDEVFYVVRTADTDAFGTGWACGQGVDRELFETPLLFRVVECGTGRIWIRIVASHASL